MVILYCQCCSNIWDTVRDMELHLAIERTKKPNYIYLLEKKICNDKRFSESEINNALSILASLYSYAEGLDPEFEHKNVNVLKIYFKKLGFRTRDKQD